MKIKDSKETLLAIIIRKEEMINDKDFATENEQEIQLASFNLSKGTEILKHYHPEQKRIVVSTSEVITLIEGKLKINIYDDNQELIASEIITSGDTVGLFSGGHGIEVLEHSKFVESKQGPYIENIDKIRF
jgi:hypothetical protein